jgi:hypothetical protein
MTIVGTDSKFKDEWLTGAARAFFVSAYADACEVFDSEHRHSGCEDCPEGESYCDRCETLAALPRASGGADWCDVAPESPIAAYALAGELWALLGVSNPGGAGVYSLANAAADADGIEHDAIDADAFGFALAMQAMGHGVSWFDDHKSFPIKVPNMECGAYTFDLDTYQGAE